MSQRMILLNITDSPRDGIWFSVNASNIPYIMSKKDEVIEALQKTIEKVQNESWPFNIAESVAEMQKNRNDAIRLFISFQGGDMPIDEAAELFEALDDDTKNRFFKLAKIESCADREIQVTLGSHFM